MDKSPTYPEFGMVQGSLVLAVNARGLGDVSRDGQPHRHNRILKDHDVSSLKKQC